MLLITRIEARERAASSPKPSRYPFACTCKIWLICVITWHQQSFNGVYFLLSEFSKGKTTEISIRCCLCEMTPVIFTLTCLDYVYDTFCMCFHFFNLQIMSTIFEKNTFYSKVDFGKNFDYKQLLQTRTTVWSCPLILCVRPKKRRRLIHLLTYNFIYKVCK